MRNSKNRNIYTHGSGANNLFLGLRASLSSGDKNKSVVVSKKTYSMMEKFYVPFNPVKKKS